MNTLIDPSEVERYRGTTDWIAVGWGAIGTVALLIISSEASGITESLIQYLGYAITQIQ